MKRTLRSLSFMVLGGLLLIVPRTGFAADAPVAESDILSLPSVTLSHWKNSSKSERMAFLLGFLTAIEMEKEWQGKKGLPISMSTTRSWVKGLEGINIEQIDKGLDRYIAQHPDEMDAPVLRVLGVMYVRPKLTPVERKDAAERYKQISQDN